MENELENQDSLNLEETQDSNLENESEEESVESLKEKLSKSEEYAKNQKIRAEKAEKALKQVKPVEKVKETETPKNEKKEDLSLKDIRALQDVHDDDVDEVIEFAKFKGISIAEAKKTASIQSLLKVKTEERATAAATNVGGAKRVTSKASGDDLSAKIEKHLGAGDETTDLTDEDFAAAARARIAKRMGVK